MIVLFLVSLVVGRVVGWSVLPVLILITHLFEQEYSHKWFGWLVIFGVLTDSVMGNAFGITSLLFLATYIELSIYKEKVDSAGGGAIFLIGILVTAQTSIFWGISAPWWYYLVNGIATLGIWLLRSSANSRGFQSGVYLRKSSS